MFRYDISSVKVCSERAKREQRRKFSFMSAAYSLILFGCTLIFVSFAPTFAWCEKALTRQNICNLPFGPKRQHQDYVLH